MTAPLTAPVQASSGGTHAIEVSYDTLNGVVITTPAGFLCTAPSTSPDDVRVECTPTYANSKMCGNPAVHLDATGSAALPTNLTWVTAESSCHYGDNAKCDVLLGVLPTTGSCSDSSNNFNDTTPWTCRVTHLSNALIVSYDATCEANVS